MPWISLSYKNHSPSGVLFIKWFDVSDVVVNIYVMFSADMN
tara:strand:+ start:2886 stop:3008 length:123 start_codon:yes stop_codon:yes gene_type:complete